MKISYISRAKKSRAILVVLALLLLSGCQSTRKQELEGQLNVLNSASAATQTTLNDIRTGKIPPPGDIYLFFSYSAINQALARVDNYSFPVQGNPDIKINIKSVRIAATGASPTVSVDASATKGAINVDVALGVILVPESTHSGKPALRMKILSFSPKVRWWIFELTKAKFIKSLLAVEVSKLADNMPIIELPVSQELSLGTPESTIRQSLLIEGKKREERATLVIDINIPSTLRKRELTVSKYLFLEKGLHVYGVLK
ncbi:hypothetical protein PQS90_06000 [Pseudomonas sp. BLCC-B13]|uniref:hypothetical protein n=1 Tax=Pseudomonas sp. BLCC-B13 TaxID=3025314 RepID=UPI00234EBC39|nr:hypothetical protein [Pseudomonas sp. BLCC-B13]MDC7824699.1 hypothetical protein [Pseudomonas sp. BLCC-B13]